MLVSTPETVSEVVVDQSETPVVVDEMFDHPNIPPAEEQSAEGVDQDETETSQEDIDERLWWDKVEVMGRIKDCARMIEEYESEIDGYQEQIKEAKEVLKGQQALLHRYSSQLADIMDGRPLPRNPNQPQQDESSDTITSVGESDGAGDWRDYPTDQLLSGVKGLGAKKLDAITEAAPTAGKLEELRGQASVQHKHFKEVLPKGCGESMADEIENRLIDLIAKQSAVEAEADDDSESDEYEDAE